MGKAKMIGSFPNYVPNHKAATPGRKKTAMVKQIGKHDDTRDLVKRYFEKMRENSHGSA